MVQWEPVTILPSANCEIQSDRPVTLFQRSTYPMHLLDNGLCSALGEFQYS
jgi:hypothetical protein